MQDLAVVRILYLMHIDWRWIKQRPHFLAENLAEKHDLLAIYRINPSRWKLCRNVSSLRRMPFLPIPGSWNSWSQRLDSSLQRRWLSTISSKFPPDLVWITFPTLYSYLPSDLKRLPVVYDCMDDAIMFQCSPSARKRIVCHEEKLVNNAASVICASRTLCRRIKERYVADGKIHLVRNGAPADLFKVAIETNSSNVKDLLFRDKSRSLNAVYFGTIARWFDFSTVVGTLNRIPELRIHLIGPKDHPIPIHDRLIYHGIIDRDKLLQFVEKYDVFIMPFQVNPLVEGVDPVKLYEYIAFGKEVISVYYPEIEHFSHYVHFYNSCEQFSRILTDILAGRLECKLTMPRALDFLKENTWHRRISEVEQILSSIVPMPKK